MLSVRLGPMPEYPEFQQLGYACSQDLKVLREWVCDRVAYPLLLILRAEDTVNST
jgi:hypothetical protein